jgi:hypothetical protein
MRYVDQRLPLHCTMQHMFSETKVMANSAAWVASDGVGRSLETAHCQVEVVHHVSNKV